MNALPLHASSLQAEIGLAPSISWWVIALVIVALIMLTWAALGEHAPGLISRIANWVRLRRRLSQVRRGLL